MDVTDWKNTVYAWGRRVVTFPASYIRTSGLEAGGPITLYRIQYQYRLVTLNAACYKADNLILSYLC